jgi:hypothetical protein
LRWVWPQHADDDVVRDASDERLASRSPREDIGDWRLGEDASGNGLHRPGVDEAEGVEAHGGPRSQRDSAPSIRSTGVRRDTRCAPT